MITLGDVKIYLNITWSDTDTDNKVNGIVARATAAMRKLIGNDDLTFVAASASNATIEDQLFLDCCRYMINNAYEDFTKNFLGDITALRAEYAVTAAEAAAESETEGGNSA